MRLFELTRGDYQLPSAKAQQSNQGHGIERAISRPNSLADALKLMDAGGWTPAAGFTDIFPAEVGAKLWECLPNRRFLDLTGLSCLRQIEYCEGGLRIGSCVTWTDIANADLPPGLDALKQAAVEVGGVQIQNRATIGGNICNASPAADGVPVLAMLDATVELRSSTAIRTMALVDFIRGNRKTDLRWNELLTSITIPNVSLRTPSQFTKLGSRKYLVISIVSVAAALDIGGGVIRSARIGIGACSAAPLRLDRLERRISSLSADANLDEIIREQSMFDGLKPIDDVRATQVYRLEAAREITLRVLRGLQARAGNDKLKSR